MSPGLAMSVGLVVGAIAAGPLCFALGVFARRDRRVTRDLTSTLALRRSVR